QKRWNEHRTDRGPDARPLPRIATAGATGQAGRNQSLRIQDLSVLLTTIGQGKPASPGFLFAQFQILGKELQQRRRGGLRDSQRRPDSPRGALPGRRARELPGSAGGCGRQRKWREERQVKQTTISPMLSVRNGAKA